MLISRKHRFIFVHIYKTAGSSMRAALLPFVYYNGLHKFVLEMYAKAGRRPSLILDPKPCVNDHSNVREIVAVIGQKTFDEYFSFVIVRNPWDWHVSHYNYVIKTPANSNYDFFTKSFPDFTAYLRWTCANPRFQKDFIYSVDDKLLVNFVGRYENIDDDFQTICKRIGIRAELPVTNVSKTKPYQEYYTPETVELVRKAYAPDIRLFEYDF